MKPNYSDTWLQLFSKFVNHDKNHSTSKLAQFIFSFFKSTRHIKSNKLDKGRYWTLSWDTRSRVLPRILSLLHHQSRYLICEQQYQYHYYFNCCSSSTVRLTVRALHNNSPIGFYLLTVGLDWRVLCSGYWITHINFTSTILLLPNCNIIHTQWINQFLK